MAKTVAIDLPAFEAAVTALPMSTALTWPALSHCTAAVPVNCATGSCARGVLLWPTAGDAPAAVVDLAACWPDLAPPTAQLLPEIAPHPAGTVGLAAGFLVAGAGIELGVVAVLPDTPAFPDAAPLPDAAARPEAAAALAEAALSDGFLAAPDVLPAADVCRT